MFPTILPFPAVVPLLPLLVIVLPSADAFAPVGKTILKHYQPETFKSSLFLVSSSSKEVLQKDGGDGSSSFSGLLPPGRRTPKRFFNFLFDDSLSLLNPGSMASYQVKRKNQFGPVFKTNIFAMPAVIVCDEPNMKELATQEGIKNLEAFFPPHHKKLFGQKSLLVQSGPSHARLRRLIQPSMSPKTISSYVSIIDEAVETFVEGLRWKQGSFPVVPELRAFFISIALEVLLGTKEINKHDLAQDISIWSKGLVAPPLTFIPWSTAAKAMRARKRITNELEHFIENERTFLTANEEKPTLLAKLVSARDEDGDLLSTQEIVDNVLTLIFAGSDTTASAASSLWMAISQKPELKQRLKEGNEEIIGAFVSSILEAYPPAPFSMRRSKDDLQIGDYNIPSGWLVIYGFAGTLLSKQSGDGGLADVTASLKSPASSLAFGAGPRMCPGRYLAALELQSLCKKILTMEWKLEEDQNLDQRYTPGFFPVGELEISMNPSP